MILRRRTGEGTTVQSKNKKLQRSPKPNQSAVLQERFSISEGKCYSCLLIFHFNGKIGVNGAGNEVGLLSAQDYFSSLI